MVISILPPSFAEIVWFYGDYDFFDFAYRGGYPSTYDVDIPPKNYYQTYVKSYMERDVAGFFWSFAICAGFKN